MGKDHPHGPDLCSKTAGPETSFLPSSFFLSLISLSKSWVNYMKWTLPLPPTTIPDSFTVIPSLHHQWELRQDLDDCRVTVRAYLKDFSGRLFVRNSQVSLLVVFSWPHFEPERDWQWEVWSCRCMWVSDSTMDVQKQEKSSKTCRR